MAQIQTTNEQENQIEKEIQTELEILKWTGQIQSNIKENITSDIILAHLDTKNKEYIQEMTINAYFIKRIINMLAKRKKPQWNNNTKNWEYIPANQQQITHTANRAFNSIIKQMDIITALNRNNKNNHMINLYGKIKQEPEPPEPEQEPTQKIYDKIMNKKPQEEQQ